MPEQSKNYNIGVPNTPADLHMVFKILKKTWLFVYNYALFTDNFTGKVNKENQPDSNSIPGSHGQAGTKQGG